MTWGDDILGLSFMWVLIKINVSGKGTIADQPRINRGPTGGNRGGILFFFPMSFVEKKNRYFYIHRDIYKSQACTAINPLIHCQRCWKNLSRRLIHLQLWPN